MLSKVYLLFQNLIDRLAPINSVPISIRLRNNKKKFLMNYYSDNKNICVVIRRKCGGNLDIVYNFLKWDFFINKCKNTLKKIL